MANFCPKCGQPVNPGDKYCEKCGAKLRTTIPGATSTAQAHESNDFAQAPAYEPAQAYAQESPNQNAQASGNVHMGIPAPGYSSRVNDPEILRAMKKMRRASGIFGMFVIPLPLIGFVIYASVTGDMEVAEAVKYGLIVSAIFLAFAVFSALKQRMEKPYDGVVTDKKIMNQRTHKLTYSQRRRLGIDDGDKQKEFYVTYVRTSTGEVKKITDSTTMFHSAWNYLEVGDRFMYHPNLNFPYEKYDKTHETHLYCVGCLKKNPITADRCSKCGLPLLK